MPASSFNNPERRQHWMAMVTSFAIDIDPTVMKLMEEMRLVAHALRLIGEDSLAKSGLSYAQYGILFSLHAAEHIEGRTELNPSEISEKRGTSRNTISSLINSLEKRELIERHLDEKDKRRFNISLTPAGRDLVKQNTKTHMKTVADCFTILTPDEQTQLSQLLNKLGHHIQLQS
jgi:DNA-binding MarR family transcriptional regulator